MGQAWPGCQGFPCRASRAQCLGKGKGAKAEQEACGWLVFLESCFLKGQAGSSLDLWHGVGSLMWLPICGFQYTN